MMVIKAVSIYRFVTPPDLLKQVLMLQWAVSVMLTRACPLGYNALAETTNGLYKAEVIHKNGPWRGLDEVERARLPWVDWFKHRRL